MRAHPGRNRLWMRRGGSAPSGVASSAATDSRSAVWATKPEPPILIRNADYALLPSREQTRSASAECLVPGGSSGMRCPFAGPWGWPLGLVPLPDMSVRALARACGPGGQPSP